MHPSTFARFRGLGVSLVAEDNVFRVHVRSFHNPQTFGLGDDRLGLAPQARVTLEWSIYPLPGENSDYGAFVNAVRRNWDVNYTIPGAFIFSGSLPRDLTGEQYARWMHDRGVKYICGGVAGAPTAGTPTGPAWPVHPFIAAERDWVTKMAAADPDLVPLAYFHAQCCTEPDSRRKYADSRLLDDQGEQIDYPYTYSDMVNTHLACPLGLGNHNLEATHAESTAMCASCSARRRLLRPLLQPRTGPVELHLGSVPHHAAADRSGLRPGPETYPHHRLRPLRLPRRRAAEVYVVNAAGERVETGLAEEMREGDRHFYDLRMPSDHFAVLVKLTMSPLTASRTRMSEPDGLVSSRFPSGNKVQLVRPIRPTLFS